MMLTVFITHLPHLGYCCVEPLKMLGREDLIEETLLKPSKCLVLLSLSELLLRYVVDISVTFL